MSIDRTLKVKGALSRHRNVLSRAERIGQLKDEERWADGSSAFALPKVAHRKSHAGRKAKEAPAKEAAPETAAAIEAPAAGPAKSRKGASPASTK